MADFATSLNNFASWAGDVKTGVQNVKDVVGKKEEAVQRPIIVSAPAKSFNVEIAGYSFDWRVLIITGVLLVGIVVFKITRKK